MVFNFRKIASAITSLAMVGSTVALAAAAAYPAPFVQNGVADVAIVYGSNLDLGAVTDVTNSLSAALTSSTNTTSNATSTAGTTPTGGDFVKLALSSNNLNLGNEVTAVFRTAITDDDLPVLLADGTYRNDKNDDFDYEQKVTLTAASMVLSYFSDSDYLDRTPSVGINMTNTAQVINYTLDFTDDAKSGITSGDLVDLENTNIKFMGRDYFISNWDDNTSNEVTLLDSAVVGIVSEGETKTSTVDGKAYNVKIFFVDSNSAKLDVNGEVTNDMLAGQTYKLNDGTYVGIKEITKLEVAGELGSVEYSLGSGKLVMKNGQAIKLNDDTISPLTFELVQAAGTSTEQKIDRMNLVWTNDDDEFITPEQDLVMPGFGTLKLSMNDFVKDVEEVTRIEEDGTSAIRMNTEIEKGDVSIPLLYANNTGELKDIGKSSSDRLATGRGNALVYNDTLGDRQFVGSWNTTTDSESYVLKFADFVKDNGVNKTTLYSKEDGEWVAKCTERKNGDTCTLGSLTVTIALVSDSPHKAANITVNAGGSFDRLYTKTGMVVYLPVNDSVYSPVPGAITFNGSYPAAADSNFSGQNQFQLVFREEDKDDNLGAGTIINITVNDNSDGEVEAAAYALNIGRSAISDPDDSNLVSNYALSDLATKIVREGQASDQREVTLEYHGDEMYAELFLTAAAASTGGATQLGTVSVLDTALATSGMQTKNLILVGGTCVNSATANALDIPASTCGSAWTAATGVGTGQWLIETVANPWAATKVATVVAGYEQGDTTNAATALRTQTNVDVATGKKYTGSTATSATLVTT